MCMTELHSQCYLVAIDANGPHVRLQDAFPDITLAGLRLSAAAACHVVIGLFRDGLFEWLGYLIR